MLTHFPNPYPEEWWYSILCRYYISSGIKENHIVKEELFGSDASHMGVLFPNGTMATVLEKIPKNLLTFDEALLNHTPFKYYVRFYSQNDQAYLIKYLREGGSPQLTHLWRSYDRKQWKPRYCPVCAGEDSETYGEPYYHVEHQIPIVSACHKHGCKLKMIDIQSGKWSLNSRFYPLSLEELDCTIEEAKQCDIRISEIVYDYNRLSFSYCKTDGYNNLYQKLVNDGYGVISRKDGVTINCNKLIVALRDFYGNEIVNHVFGNDIDNGKMLRIKRFEQLLADRYILLQGLLGLSVEDFLSNSIIKDELKDSIQNLSGHKRFSTLKQYANELNLKEYEVVSLCKYYGIPPFWVEKNTWKHDGTINKKIVCTVSQREYEQIVESAKKYGFSSPGEFLVKSSIYNTQ